MNPSTLTINNSLKSIGLMQNTSPLLNKPLPHSTIKLPRIKIFISGFKNYQFCQNSGNVANDRGWGVILFALSWRIAYKNRYMTRTSVFLQHREIITVLAITLDKLNITFFMKILTSFIDQSRFYNFLHVGQFKNKKFKDQNKKYLGF